MERGYEARPQWLSRRDLLRGAAGLGLAAATGTLLSACGSGGGEENEEAAGPDPDAPLETTSINLFALPPFNCFAPQYMAESFLREEGFTDITYQPHSPPTLVDKFAAGEIDFGIAYQAFLTPHIEAGKPFVLLGGLHLGCWEVVATGDIKSMRDFKGKTVSIVGPNFTDGIFMAMTLANVGLDLRKDVKVVNFAPPDFARILSSGEVDPPWV